MPATIEVPGLSPRLARMLGWVERRSRIQMAVIGFAPILLIGALNYYTTPQLSSSFFYLLPILFVTHFLGRKVGTVAAVLATSLWFWVDMTGGSVYSSAWIPCLNAVMRLGVFLIVLWLLTAMHALMDSLERRVEERTAQLKQESSERRELERRILEISEREQARMGQDLHDGLCQHLVGTAFSVNLLYQRLCGGGHPEAEAVGRIGNMLDDSITEARRLARGLYPVRIEDLGLNTALQEIAETMQGMFHLECEFRQEGNAVNVDQSASVHLYRIAREAVTNAVKHARPQRIRILLRGRPRQVELRIEDDGIGIGATPASAGGLGIRIMEFRARIIGARFEIAARHGCGTVVRCLMEVPECAESPPTAYD